MNELLWFLLFFIPAYVSNMVPPFFRKLPFSYPLDGNASFRGKRLLGKNKTWRGLILGTLCGGLVGYAMESSGLPFTGWWGFALGFAALAGDAIKSFFKRQMDIGPGQSWIPFDQLDFMITSYLVSLLVISFSFWAIVTGFVIIFVGTVLVQVLGGATGVKADGL